VFQSISGCITDGARIIPLCVTFSRHSKGKTTPAFAFRYDIRPKSRAKPFYFRVAGAMAGYDAADSLALDVFCRLKKSFFADVREMKTADHGMDGIDA
jgi:hypothetical protein